MRYFRLLVGLRQNIRSINEAQSTSCPFKTASAMPHIRPPGSSSFASIARDLGLKIHDI
jgi:hypothetical protein